MIKSYRYNALDIARYFVRVVERDVGDSITNLKLQKLVYYAQGWSLAILDKSLFAEDLQAWAHGPATPSVWRHYREYSWEALPPPEEGRDIKKAEVVELLSDVNRIYGVESAKQLEWRTHEEDPWRLARGNLSFDARSEKVITKQSMKDYFISQKKKKQ